MRAVIALLAFVSQRVCCPSLLQVFNEISGEGGVSWQDGESRSATAQYSTVRVHASKQYLGVLLLVLAVPRCDLVFFFSCRPLFLVGDWQRRCVVYVYC